MRKAVVLCLLLIVLAFRLVAAQNASDPYQVFLINGDQLDFIDLRTGAQNQVAVTGDHFTIVGDQVMYYDHSDNRVMLVAPDGTLTPHPFIQPDEGVMRIDWHISHDGQTIAWTETSGEPSALVTNTWIAQIDGTQKRAVFEDGPRNGIRAYPVAFSADKSILYMDYQPDTIGDLTPFRQYAGLFSLDLVSGKTNSLPGEPGCFCGAGIDADVFLRLTLANGGFNLRIHSLANSTDTTLPPVNNFTQGGDVLIAPDGNRAVYALAQISGFGTQQQSIQTVIVLVDLLNLTQQPLGQPLDHLLRPLLWTEDDSAVLLVDPQTQTTWKATIRDGSFQKVANGIYLGTV
ncbi:MAG TPA: hypothetical protein VHD90_26405 [Phototrophicaceae bacterium]|nr:hypothetical protein [Phototrophicaceae bacterium]